MQWTQEKLNQLPITNGFRMRGLEMTRLETFLDAAFAFATTMLVISVGGIPQTYQEFITAIKGIPAFAASFCIIMLFWQSHRQWSRRYGLEDNASTLISLGIMFIILVYIYPLKLMFSSLFGWITGGWLPFKFTMQSVDELLDVFAIYGLGLAALTSLMALLFRCALKKAADLGLNPYEHLKTAEEIACWMAAAITGLISALMALFMPPMIAIFAGFVYITIPITIILLTAYYKKKAKSIPKKT